MGLDMFVFKYNKGMDEETFYNVVEARRYDDDIEGEFLKDFYELTNCVDLDSYIDYKSEKLMKFYEKHLSKSILSGITSKPMSESEFKDSKELDEYKGDYNDYVTHFESCRDDLLARLFSDLRERIGEIEQRSKMCKELSDLLSELEEPQRIAYWRKHSDLNGYMEELYREKGGNNEFNCSPLYLEREDVEMIISDHEKHLDTNNDFSICESRGFFWGESDDEDWADSLKDFKRILEETDWDNETVYYYCWW